MAASTGSGTQGCPTPSRLRLAAPGRGGRPSLREQQTADLIALGGAREHRTRSSVSHQAEVPARDPGGKDNGIRVSELGREGAWI